MNEPAYPPNAGNDSQSHPQSTRDRQGEVMNYREEYEKELDEWCGNCVQIGTNFEGFQNFPSYEDWLESLLSAKDREIKDLKESLKLVMCEYKNVMRSDYQTSKNKEPWKMVEWEHMESLLTKGSE